ncbi:MULTISPECIES: DUF2157 domain-containing protein [unclassified Psychrobacter]|uniref:DUF2157 domain-containing protein n=1 Tax=unclassified Psychrobacter TaxID=196806 RepID=UPI000EBF326A|nr:MULTISPECIES: DUF2157 domain-containing protein [unclassified Psychrobacter]MBE8609875.1 DUF2157 domain-containing protein [Pseudomonas lundensis]HCI76123.1 hypothetical protein [Psychrobacter sp.]
MSQPRRTIEHLLKQGILPLTHANDAAIHLQVYPSKRSWLVFFDKAMLIIGAIALVLSLVFFIAYNWINMGKMGKFALVEGALVITIALYVVLSFRQKFQLVRQLLLLIASVITGSLLALFGQVYQTGADTWQLFFGWAVLIIPWVIIARFPALWLLWLGLVNTGLILYFGVTDFAFVSYFYEGVLQIGVLAAVNFVALNLWLAFIDRQLPSVTRSRFKSELNWSAYVVGLLSSYFITYLAILYVFDDANILMTMIALLLWMSWCGFMVWRFYWYRINLLMLTYLCGSVIVVVMFWAGKLFLDNFDMGGFLILALLLIGMSSAAVVWLRHAARLNSENNLPTAVVKGGNYE